MPRHIENSVNDALGNLLRLMLPGFDVHSEQTQTIAGHSGRRPDILIAAPDRSPVVVEAEYLPAYDAEKEARERLGLLVTVHPRPIEAAIALRYPEELGDADDLPDAVADARLSYCVFTVEKYSQTPAREVQSIARFPQSGWLDGSAGDLADLIRLVSVPQKAVDEAADTMEGGIEGAFGVLEELARSRPNITASIARLLGMDNVPQTRRMAGAIIANAMVFHERIAGIHPNIKPLGLVSGPGIRNPRKEMLTAWTEILEINYWAIFAIGKDILQQLPAAHATRILQALHYRVDEVNALGIANAHDLTGRVFQRLISDRKYLATFYTLPASAALLARLAVAKLDGVDWGDPNAIGRLRVADFACGTGALLSAVYEQIAARHENAGGNPARLHRAMMEEALYGRDVMPSAIHITGSTLAGLQPSVGFNKSNLLTLPYGRQSDDTVAIGSLELLDPDSEPSESIPDESFDLVIMNPPFTRNTTREGATADAVAAAFAAFGASEADQREMAKRMGKLKAGTCYHGNAGIASAFAALAQRKLKPGGVLALVLPLSAAAGLSWRGFRQMLATEYDDLTVLSIASNDKDMSFSSDTGMAECLVIGRKLKAAEAKAQRVHFTSLTRRPQGFAHASSMAKNIIECDYVRQIEDGPYGGTPLMVGDEWAGEMLTAPCYSDGAAWGSVRLSDHSLAQTADALSRSKLWLPGRHSSLKLKATTLVSIGSLGLYHLDIIGRPPRGPFTKLRPSPTATYPAVWNHDAKRETQMVCEPDSQLQVRPGMEDKAVMVWETRSRSHLNLDFTFGSQALVIAFTERESIGGRVWPNVIFEDKRFDYAFTVWGNSTLGLLCYWWHSSRQQSSKAGMTIRSAESLPVLDLRALSEAQLTTAQEIFEEFRDKELRPAYLAAKWCAEPSVHGGKKRPQGATLAV